MRFAARVRSLLRSLSRGGSLNRDLDDEMAHHVDQHAARLVRESGLEPADARRQALLDFGSMDRYREEGRDVRGLTRLSGMSMDFRLGARMLVRYPGLTLVGGLALAFAIWVGSAMYEITTQMTQPQLPLDEAGSIVGIRSRDVATGMDEQRVVNEFLTWRTQLETVEGLSAFRSVERNLMSAGAAAEPVYAAEMTASGFAVARVAPLRGRTFTPADEAIAAPAVVVLGYGIWRHRFDGDPSILGRSIDLGGRPHTVIGIMPEGFAFPVNHDVWVPLRTDAKPVDVRSGPEVHVFGRIAENGSIARAQVELESLGARAGATRDGTGTLVHDVLPYAQAITGTGDVEIAAMLGINLFLAALLTLIGTNVALLLFARAATRESEIVVRSALGASRGRIVMQLFVEALVLGTVAAVAGLAAARVALRWFLDVYTVEAGGRLPFWFTAELSRETLVYAAFLTLFAAAVSGIVPALRITRHVGQDLRQIGAGGGGVRFGGIWTAVIVAQVAVTVAFPATAFFVRRDVVRIQSVPVPIAPSEYVVARLEFDGDAEQVYPELERRLELEPGIRGITFGDRLPRMYHPQQRVEVEDLAPANDGLVRLAGSATVSTDFLDVLGLEPVAGRGFSPADAAAESRVVIANESFVTEVLDGQNAIGRRVRVAEVAGAGPGPWFEVIGVVPDAGMVSSTHSTAGLYRPAAPGVLSPAWLTVHAAADPAMTGSQVRRIAADVNPALRVMDIMPIERAGDTMWLEFSLMFRVLTMVSAVALMLSLAAIYAVMSFTVTRRTREIGIRVALGSGIVRVVTAIFRRPVTQVALGVLAGTFLVGALTYAVLGSSLTAVQVLAVAGYAALMMAVCMLACVVPTWRALRVQPAETLRTDG